MRKNVRKPRATNATELKGVPLRSGLIERRERPSRLDGREREDEILTAARRVLIEQGYANFTLRKIATAGGVSLSHLQYYFPTKAELVRALFEDVSKVYEVAHAKFLALEDEIPVARLSAWIDFLLDDCWHPDVRRFFIQLWGLLESEGGGDGSLLREFYEVDINEIARLISDVNTRLGKKPLRQRATIIASAIEGMMLMVNVDTQDKRSYEKMRTEVRDSLVQFAVSD